MQTTVDILSNSDALFFFYFCDLFSEIFDIGHLYLCAKYDCHQIFRRKNKYLYKNKFL